VTNGPLPFEIYGFLPITDLKQFIEVVKAIPQLNGALKVNGDVYELQLGGPPVYVKQIANWAVVTNKTENLAKAPADPLTLLGDLPKNYDLAVRLSVKNAPKEFRDQAVAGLRAAAEAGTRQMPGESDDDYAVRVNMARHAVESLSAMVDDLDDVLLGWNFDPTAKTTHLDVETTAQAGTKLANRFAQMKPGKTNFAGLLVSNPAATANLTRALADEDVTEVKNALAAARKSLLKTLQNKKLPEAETKLATQLLSDVLDVVEKTVEGKKIDVALMLALDPGAATLVAGGTIADGAKLEKALKQLVDRVQQEDAQVAKSDQAERRDLRGRPVQHV